MSELDLPGDGPWVTNYPTRVGVYHTDEGCTDLGRARRPREVSDAAIEWHDLEECQRCAGDRGPNTSGSMHPLATGGGGGR